MAMTRMVLVLKQCPECGGQSLIPVATTKGTNFFCQDCIFCWHLEQGHAQVIDPQTCPGCQLGTIACFERWEVFQPLQSRGSSKITSDAIVGPGGSGQEDNMGWADIESELYCSAREACIGSGREV
jgi:hypothetical protein